MVPKVTTPKPCCFIDLKTGAVLIGIIELVVWSSILTISTLTLSTISGLIVEDESFNTTEPGTGIQVPEEYDESKMTEEFSIHTVYVLLSLSVALSATWVLNGSILLLGVHKSSTFLLKIWLCIKILSFLLTIGSFVNTLLKGTATVGMDLVYGVSLLTSVFFIIIILSLHASMKLEELGRALRYKF